MRYVVTVEGGGRYSLDIDKDLEGLAKAIVEGDVLITANQKTAIMCRKVLLVEKID